MDYLSLIKSKYGIGTAVLVILLGSFGYLSPYFFDAAWQSRGVVDFVVVERNDDIHVLIENQITGYTRYSIDNDWIKTYAGTTYLTQNRYRPCYWRTYGEDKWICLERKASKIETWHESDEEYVHVYRETEYYAYNYASGSGGTLLEEYIFGKETYKQKVYFTPENDKRKHKIIVEVQLDKDIEQGRDMEYKAELFHKGIPIVLDYSDIAGQLESKTYTTDNMKYEVDCGKGYCEIDPGIGVGYANYGIGIARAPKWNPELSSWSFRVGIRVYADGAVIPIQSSFNTSLNLTDYLVRTGVNGTIDLNSIRVTEHSYTGGVITSQVNYFKT